MALKQKSTKRLTTFLIISLAFLSGCATGLPKPPDVQPKQILSRFDKCKIYKPRMGDKLYFDLVGEIPLSECVVDGYFVVSDKEITSIRAFYLEAKGFYEQKCVEKPRNGN